MLETIIATVLGTTIIQSLVTLWLSERLKSSLQLENSRALEAIRWEARVREQAAKVAEYLAAARDLREDDPPERHRQVTQMSWELALWLPSDVYRAMVQALVARTNLKNELTVVVQVRKLLLGDKAGDLTQDDIASHAPGAGKYRSIAKP